MQRAKKAVKAHNKTLATFSDSSYHSLIGNISALLQAAHQRTVRSVNAIMTATYWEIGHRIVEFEQGGWKRAEYGEEVLKKLSSDLTAKFGKGFAKSNLYQMRSFYLAYADIFQTVSGKSDVLSLEERFLLSWSHYVYLISLDNTDARCFYEREALRGGWSVRQLDRQISTQFYERTLLYSPKIRWPCYKRVRSLETVKHCPPVKPLKIPMYLNF